jgi:hypothetical protein
MTDSANDSLAGTFTECNSGRMVDAEHAEVDEFGMPLVRIASDMTILPAGSIQGGAGGRSPHELILKISDEFFL